MSGNEIRIFVRDNGPGLSQEAIKGFGERRVSRAIEKSNGNRLSVGLGSVIMKTVAEVHRGKVLVSNRKSPAGEVIGAEVQIALPCPKPNNTYSTALQHVAFLIKEDLSKLLEQYPEVKFDTLELTRASHPELKLRFDDLVVKFHNSSLEDLSQN